MAKKYEVTHIIQERTGRKNPVWKNIYSSRQITPGGSIAPIRMTAKEFRSKQPKIPEYETREINKSGTQIIFTTTDKYDKGKKKRRSIFQLQK